MKTGPAIVALGVMLAGCGGGGSSAPGGNTATPAPVEVNDSVDTGNSATGFAATDPVEVKINAATEAQRRTAFFRAIYDSDFTCDKIVSVVNKPRDQGRAVWLATCDDKGEYLITLQPGGTFLVSGVSQPKRRMSKSTKIIPVEKEK